MSTSKPATIITYMGDPVRAICWVDGTSADILLESGGLILNTFVGLMDYSNVGGCAEVRRAKAARSVTPRPNQLPEDSELRQQYPMADGLFDYFPNALAEVSRVSYIGNQKHNPGEPMNWARGKSTDHRNKIARHLIDAGGFEETVVDGKPARVRHSAYLAWRALANLQEELERDEGYPVSRNSTPA